MTTTPAMPLARVHNFSISLDGFGTGAGQSADAHFGHAGERLHEWMFATRWWQPGGSGGVDDVFVRQLDPGIGAEIMGAGKWGHPGWHEDPDWKGAWGPNPPFHTPVFVLTHHPRVPRRRPDRPHARRRRPDPARSGRTPLGRPGGPRGPRGPLPDRGRLLAHRSHPSDLHPHRFLNPPVRRPGTEPRRARPIRR